MNGGRQGAGILLGLAAGAEHGIVPSRRAARAVPPFAFGPQLLLPSRQDRGGVVLQDALFRLQDKAPSLVQIDPPRRVRAVQIVEQHVALEDVRIAGVVLDRRLRPGDLQHVAQFGEEKLIVGPFRAAGVRPTLDEFLNLLLVHAGCRGLKETCGRDSVGRQYSRFFGGTRTRRTTV
jgi:hypothetical protein